MERIDRVSQMIVEGKSDQYMMNKLRIDGRSLAAYKAHISRRSQDTVLGTMSQLPTAAKISFASALQALMQTSIAKPTTVPQDIGTKVDKELAALPDSMVRAIIIDLKNNGMPNEQVYHDPRLVGADKGSVSAYLAHYTRGSYDRRA